MALPTVTPRRYHRICQFALWMLVLIVVTGAGVRLTGSGMGCPEWPTCTDGNIVARAQGSSHEKIESANRTITGLVSLAVALAVLGSLRRIPRRRDLTWLSLGLVAGVIAQAILGGIVVMVHVHPIAVQGHFVLSAILVANAVVLCDRARWGDGATRVPVVGPSTARLGWALVPLASLVVLAGTVVTGTGPHAGDDAAERLDWSITTVARLHSGLTWVFLAATVAFAWRLRGEPDRGRRLDERTYRLLVAVVLQGAVGYVQYAMGVPELLVALHVLGSMLVWIAVLHVVLALSTDGPGSPEWEGDVDGTGRDLVSQR